MSVVPQVLDCIKPLDLIELKNYGGILFELFTQLKSYESESSDVSDYNSLSSYHSIGDSLLKLRFDWLYDLMSDDLEKIDEFYLTSPKLLLYVELQDFVKYVPLHEMNR